MSAGAYFVQQRNSRSGKLIPEGTAYQLTKSENL